MEKRLRKKDVEIATLRSENERHFQKIQDLEKSRVRLRELEQDGKYAQLELMVENVTGQFYKTLSRANQSDKCIEELEQRIIHLESEKILVEKEADEYRTQLGALEATLNRMLDSHCTDKCELSNTSVCPLNDLKGMNVLYVGGRASQSTRLRTMVEQCNGGFIYHDGGRHDGRQRLDKKLVMIPHASLSAFAKGLEEVAA